MLEFKNISKSFFNNKVLDSISFTVDTGEILALAGQNGAGKSTLVKILTGIHQQDSGEILIEGKSVHFASVTDSSSAGVGIVYQELSVIPDLTVTENVVLGEDVKKGFHFVDLKKQNKDVEKVFEQLGVELDVTKPLGEYPASTQQLVEIAKVIYKKPKIVILDEPTTSLTNKERERLFEVMQTMRKDGLIIIFITHYLEEMFKMADKCVILRDGKVQYFGKMKDITEKELVSYMIGQRLDTFYPEIHSACQEKVALELKDFGGGIVQPVNFKVHYGEVVGLAGLIGSGRTELMHMIIGYTKKECGQIFLDGEEVKISSPADALDKGIAYINEDRRTGGLHLEKEIDFNIVLPSIMKKQKRVVNRLGFVNEKGTKKLAEEMIRSLEVKCVDAGQLAMTLSGGNQQKVSIAKWIAAQPQVFIFDEPTKGIDVLTKARIYELIREIAAQGKAVIVISSYGPELIGVCDRIEVMSKGKMKASFTKGVTEDEIVLAQ